MRREWRSTRADLAVAVGLALVVFGPLLLGRGYWLAGDMVFVPHQPWKGAWLGLDGSLPRAVPMDALVSAATHVVPGWVVQRLLLVVPFVLGGVGAARLAAPRPWWARAAAITFCCWNPWVLERLEIGQWAILAGYFVLPWVALAARRLRRGAPGAWGAAGLALLAAGVCSPSSGLTAALALLVLAARRSWWSWARLLATAVVANLPWVVPSLLATQAHVTVDGVFAAFGARGESPAGVVPSVLSLGGIWKSSVVPPERTAAALVVLSLLLTVVALAGLRHASARAVVGETPRLLGLAAISVVLTLLPVVPGGASLLEHLGHAVPATALLRDSQRFLAPAALPLMTGLASAALWCRERVRPGREAMWAVAGLVVVAPVVLLPSLAWGGLGDLRAASYPAEWTTVSQELDDDPGPTVVLPWLSLYRGFAWDGDRAVLDPAPRFFPGDVLVDDRLFVTRGGATVVVPSEDPQVRAVDAALHAPDPASSLAALGVRWVLVEKGLPLGPGIAVPAGTTVHDGPGLRLVRLTPTTGTSRFLVRPGHTPLVITGDLLWVVLLAAAARDMFRRRE